MKQLQFICLQFYVVLSLPTMYSVINNSVKHVIVSTGRGVFATKVFLPDTFLLEYRGKRLNVEPEDVPDTYLYEFVHNGKRVWYVLLYITTGGLSL